VIPGDTFSANISTGITGASASELGLKNFYTSYLWNYCDGNNTGSNDECEKTKIGYAFNIENIIADDSQKNITFPDSVKKVQKAINVVSKFMAACYVLAGVATAVTFLVGWFGLLSRWGSCVTTIFADVSFISPPGCWGCWGARMLMGYADRRRLLPHGLHLCDRASLLPQRRFRQGLRKLRRQRHRRQPLDLGHLGRHRVRVRGLDLLDDEHVLLLGPHPQRYGC
jgi:hypothetical protein